MATTTSEIQVTEAYIGLLGRAPDPAGLAYWTAQLDAAIAAGEDAAVALKKLTNDITLSAEWDGGLGTNVATDGSVTQAGAEAIVSGMYLNLFERAATAADLTYWTAELVAGTTTASEMAVQLIQGAKASANTTDASTLGLKQEAATYYVENVPQADFSRGTAAAAVDSVNSPLTLDASKDATDIIVSGVGITKALSTSTDTIAMTGGDDTVTGLAGTGATFAAADNVKDVSSTDNDTLTITGDGEFDFGTVTNVENINVSLGARDVADPIDIDAAKLSDGTVNLTVAEQVTISGVTFAGEQTVNITNFTSNLKTTNVKALDVTGASGTQTFTLDNDAATVGIAGVTANDTTVVLANNDVTLTIGGTAATNDTMSITADNEVTINNGASDVELLTLIGGNNDAAFTMTNVADASKMVYTVSGSNDITLAGASSQFDGASLVDNNSGTETLKLTGVAVGDTIEGFGVLSGGVTLASAGTHDLKLASGNTVTNTTAGAAMTLDANDTATDSAVTINLNATANGITTKNFESVTIDANDSQLTTTGALNFTDNSGAVVTISGTNDITTGTVTGAHSFTVTGNDVTVGAITATNEVSLTGSDTVDTAAITADNDVTLTAGTGAGKDVGIAGAITISSGNLKMVGDDINAGQNLTVTKGDITLTGTNDVVTSDMTASSGDVTLTSTLKDVASTGQITSTLGNVTVSAGNDVNLAAVTAKGNVDIDAGPSATDNVSITGAVGLTAGNYTVDGDTITLGGATSVTAGDVTIAARTKSDVNSTVKADAGNIVITAAGGDVDLAESISATKGSVTLTAGNDIVMVNTKTISAQNDIDIDAGSTDGLDVNDLGVTSITGVGNLTVNGNDVKITGNATVVSGNITVTAGQDVDSDGSMTATAGDISLVATAGDLSTAAGKTLDGNDVALTASDDITSASAITADNNVTITTTGVAGSSADATQSATITTTGTGTVKLAGDAVHVAAITAAKSTIVIDADDEVVISGAIDTDASSLTITSDLAVGGADGVASTAALEAQNDVNITAVAVVDLDATVKSVKDDVIITGDTVQTTGVSAPLGDVTLTATNSAAASLSVAAGAISAVNVTLADGTHDVNEDVTATGAFTISGNAGMDLAAAKTLTAGSVNLTTANDVKVNGTTDSMFIVGSGTGDMDLGTVEYTTATTDIDIVLGAGADTMILADAGNKFLVQTNGGADNVTVNSSAAGSVINVGSGDDTVTLGAAANSKGTFDGGTGGTDTLELASADYSGATDVSWQNFEQIKLGLGGQNGTMSAAQFNGNSTFKLMNSAGVLQIEGGTGAETINASSLTFAVGTTATTKILGGNGNDVITGAEVVDVIIGGGGLDTISGGLGADDFVFTEATDGGTVGTDGAGDSVSGFVSTSDDVIIDGNLETTVGDGGNGTLDMLAVVAGGAAAAVDLDAAGANTIEGLFIADSTLASSDFTDLSDVAAYLETEITLTAAAGKDALVVIESSTAGTFAVYYYLETGATADEFNEEDLVLLGVFTGDDVVIGDITF